MSRVLDAGTLDALVLGADEPDDVQAWEALVCNPGGAEAFREAVARRRRKDQMASALLGRPWLARAVSGLLAFSRKMKSAPSEALSFIFPDRELDALVTATLGPAEQEPALEVVQPRWGQVVPVRMRPGERVTLQPAAGSDPIDVRYLCRGVEGALPTRTWALEAGEAPVLLIALVGAHSKDTLTEGLGRAAAMAGVIILDEALPTGTDVV